MTEQHGKNGEVHRHTAREILACPPDSPLGRDSEVCDCGAQRLVDVPGKPAGQWAEMTPIPYANPIGHVDGVTADDGIDFTIMDRRDFHILSVGAHVTVLHCSAETGVVAKIRGVITGGGTFNREGHTVARFRVIGFEPGQESPLRRGDPVYLEPEGSS